MDVYGSCVNVGPWGMVVELEGLSLLLKEQKKMPCRSGSPTFRQPGQKLVLVSLLCFGCCVCSYSAITTVVQSDLH